MNEWVWINGGMILTGEKWSAGRKTLYSVGGRWMNEYGTMVEWYWQGKLKCLEKKIIQRGWKTNEWVWSNGGKILTGEKWSAGRKTLYSVGGRWMNEYGAMVEWYWQGKVKYWEKTCHSVTLSTRIRTCFGLGRNLCAGVEGLAINHLSHDNGISLSCI